GGNAARDELIETAEHDIRKQAADDVTTCDRLRSPRIEDASLRGGDVERGEGARVVRDVRRDDAGERIGRVGGAIVERHVDAEARRGRRTAPVDVDLVVG